MAKFYFVCAAMLVVVEIVRGEFDTLVTVGWVLWTAAVLGWAIVLRLNRKKS